MVKLDRNSPPVLGGVKGRSTKEGNFAEKINTPRAGYVEENDE